MVRDGLLAILFSIRKQAPPENGRLIDFELWAELATNSSVEIPALGCTRERLALLYA